MNIFYQRVYAWLVHLFTASGGIFAVLALAESVQAYAAKVTLDHANYLFHLKISFAYVTIAVIIDAVDGTLARQVNITKLAPLDGALLDNIIDFVNYSIIPAVWVFITNIVPDNLKVISMILIVLASCYQFCQFDAKTDDHFFKGFPSYWNLAIYYLVYFNFTTTSSFIIILCLVILTLIPIKYIYPSRMNHLSNSKFVLLAMFTYTLVWGAATIISGIIWPQSSTILTWIIVSYLITYFLFSTYRTIFPLQQH